MPEIKLSPDQVQCLETAILEVTAATEQPHSRANYLMLGSISDNYRCLGDFQSLLGRYEEAILAYDESLKISPNHAAAYFGRAAAKVELRRYHEASHDYEEAMNLKYPLAYRGWLRVRFILCGAEKSKTPDPIIKIFGSK